MMGLSAAGEALDAPQTDCRRLLCQETRSTCTGEENSWYE